MSDIMIPLPNQSDVGAVAPQSTIIIANGIPWTNDYNHVRLFGSKSELLNFVKSKQVASFTSSTPVRWGDLTYRAKGNENSFIECNYIAFQNAPFTSTWYFGFITRVEWLSNGSCRIVFEPDFFQNNIYDVSINPCFVEREHVSRSADAIGANLQPENIETGEYIINDQVTSNSFGWAPWWVIYASATSEGQPANATYQWNTFQGLMLNACDTYADAVSTIQNYQNSGNIDAIAQIVQFPSICMKDGGGTDTLTLPCPTTLNGYTPKNKKLFQYPFNYCLLATLDGNSSVYRFEYSTLDSKNLQLNVQGAFPGQPMIWLRMGSYRIPTGLINYSDSVVISPSLQCSWVNDGYQAYIAQMTPIWNVEQKQNTYNAASGLMGGLIGLTGSMVTGNIIGAANSIKGAADSIASSFFNSQSIMAQKESHDLIPPGARGNVGGGSSNFGFVTPWFQMVNFSVSAVMAKCIDDYFEMYGYSTNSLKTPNLNSRSTWNFVKTNGASFKGSIMLDDMRKLQAIFDRGVTIWHTNDVGNYSLSND